MKRPAIPVPDTRVSPRVRLYMLALAVAGFVSSTQAVGTGPYASLHIVSPAHDATVHDNNGTVQVVVAVSPPVRDDQGHRLMLWLDGRAIAQINGTQHRLANLDRGTHTIQLQVSAGNGTTLIRSEPVTFHMRRASRLTPGSGN